MASLSPVSRKPTSTGPDLPTWEDLDRAADCIQWIDGEGRLIATSRRGLARLGMLAEGITGQPWALVWGAAAIEAMDAAMAQGEGRFQASRQLAGGVLRWWDVVVTPVRLGRHGIRFLAICRDITAAREADEKRELALASERAARSESEQAKRRIEALVSVSSHEFRTPLNAILGWLNLVRQDRSSATLEKALDVIDRNARRQVQMLDELVAASGSVAGSASSDRPVVLTDPHTGPDPTLLQGLEILLVEDEPDARDLMTRVLEDVGAKVTAADSAKGALEVLEQGYLPHMILSDIGLPGLDGYHFIQRVRNMSGSVAGIPAAAVTAFARPEDRRRALFAGYQAHLGKPVDRDELVATVTALTGLTGGHSHRQPA